MTGTRPLSGRLTDLYPAAGVQVGIPTHVWPKWKQWRE